MPVEFASLDAGDALPEAAPVVPVLVGGGHGGRQQEAHRAHSPADRHPHPSDPGDEVSPGNKEHLMKQWEDCIIFKNVLPNIKFVFREESKKNIKKEERLKDRKAWGLSLFTEEISSMHSTESLFAITVPILKNVHAISFDNLQILWCFRISAKGNKYIFVSTQEGNNRETRR